MSRQRGVVEPTTGFAPFTDQHAWDQLSVPAPVLSNDSLNYTLIGTYFHFFKFFKLHFEKYMVPYIGIKLGVLDIASD